MFVGAACATPATSAPPAPTPLLVPTGAPAPEPAAGATETPELTPTALEPELVWSPQKLVIDELAGVDVPEARTFFPPALQMNSAAEEIVLAEQQGYVSCPFLFTWNGEFFEFVTDFMWSSPLGVPDFLKRTSVIRYSGRAIERFGEMIEKFAIAEGLTGHARSITIRRHKA